MSITIKDLVNFPNGLAISWSDDSETYIDYHILRDNCPCANCSGESDIFGNIYKGINIKKMGKSYELKNILQVSIMQFELHGKMGIVMEFYLRFTKKIRQV